MRSSTIITRVGVLVLVLALAPIAPACGGDDDTASTTTPEASAPVGSTTADSDTTATTTPPPVSTSTAPPTTTSVDTETLASGSGCTPGAGDLPDGEWFGFVADASAGGIEFDLACWFVGDAAIAATAEDGEESPPPNDYYVRNTNPALRTISVTGDAEVIWLPDIGTPTSATIDYPDWLVARVARGIELQPGVWITVSGGDVAVIEEQWVP
jgi:hypothetical protein